MRQVIYWGGVLLFFLAARPGLSQDTPTAWDLKIKAADQLIQEQQYEKALRLLQEIYPQAQALEDCYWEGWSALWLGEAYYQTGQVEPAIEVTLEGKKRVDSCLATDTLGYYSLMLQNLGVFYSYTGDYNRQMEYYQLSFAQAMKTHGKESSQAADAYYSMGVAYGRRGYWEKCLDYTDTSLQISRAIDYKGGEASALHNLAFVYGLKKDYQRAINAQEDALLLTNIKEEQIIGLKNLGIWYASLGQVEAALEKMEKSLELAFLNYPRHSGRTIQVLINTADVYILDENYPQAEKVLREALGYLQKAGIEDPNYITILNKLSGLQSRSGKYDQAMATIRKAASIECPVNEIRSAVLLTRGMLMGHFGQPLEGARDLQQALQLAVPSFEGNDPLSDHPRLEAIQNYDLTLELLHGKAELIFQKGESLPQNTDYFERALEIYELADSLVAKMRLLFQHTGSRESLLARSQSLYGSAIKACDRLFRLTGDEKYINQAFLYAEKNKSQLVAESLNDLYVRDFTGIPDELIKTERQLISDIEFYNGELNWARSIAVEGEMTERWEDELRKSRKQLEQVWNRLRTEHPDYFQMRYSLDLKGISEVSAQILGDKEVLIEYFLGRESIYVFLLDGEGSELISWEKPAHLDNSIALFRESILNQGEDYWTLGHELYQILLEPLEPYIREKDLCLIPDGVLAYLPFETLLTEAVSDPRSNLREQPFLLQQHQIRYLLSGQVGILAEMQKDRRNREGKVLAMAPDFGASARTVDLERDNGKQVDLPRLEGALQEITQLSGQFRGRFLTGEQATKSAFLRHAPDYSVLHVATHTLIEDDFPAYSRLVFSSRPGSVEEQQLRIYEIYGLDLEADLVILSACNTGIGAIRKGEGVYSLARAFAFAGSPNLVMTLWPVKDKTTAALMERFYRNLERGMEKSTALTQAKRDYIQHARSSLLVHPYYWGGILYSGDLATLDLKSRTGGWTGIGWWGLLILFLGGAAWFTWNRARP